MNKYYSLTFLGLISQLIASVFTTFQIPITENEWDTFVKVLWMLISLGVSAYGRIRHGDINWLGFKNRNIG